MGAIVQIMILMGLICPKHRKQKGLHLAQKVIISKQILLSFSEYVLMFKYLQTSFLVIHIIISK